MGKKKKDNGAEDFAAETQEDQDTLPTDGDNILDDGGIAPGSEDAPAAEESDTEERDDAALENPAVAPAGDAPGSDILPDAPAEAVEQADDKSGDEPDAAPAGTDPLAEAAKPPEEVAEPDPVGTAVQGTALATDSADPAHAGSDVIPVPNDEPAAAAPAEVTGQGDEHDDKPAGDSPMPGADAAGAEAGAAEAGKDGPVEEALGEATGSATDATGEVGDDALGKPTESSTSSSASAPADSSSDVATEPEMPVLSNVHPEAAPIAEAAGPETMDNFKEAGNLMTKGLAELRSIEHKLEELGDEAKARLAHLRHKATEALAALEAWFSRS